MTISPFALKTAALTAAALTLFATILPWSSIDRVRAQGREEIEDPPPGLDSQDAVDALCPDRFAFAAGGSTLRIPYCRNRSLDVVDATVQRAVIVVHGSNRNADDYYSYVQNSASAAGAASSTIIIAPQLLEQEDVSAFNLPGDHPFWDGGWREGDNSLSTPRVSSFGPIDAIVRRLANRGFFPNLRDIVVTGHSAGGQVINRFAAGSRVEQEIAPTGTQLKYVIANPSSYVYFTPERRVPGSTTQFALPSASARNNCPTYDTYKYGLQSLNPYMQAVGPTQIKANTNPA